MGKAELWAGSPRKVPCAPGPQQASKGEHNGAKDNGESHNMANTAGGKQQKIRNFTFLVRQYFETVFNTNNLACLKNMTYRHEIQMFKENETKGRNIDVNYL